MVRPPHLPPIDDEEAKRKWEIMNRPSIIRLYFGPKKEEKIKIVICLHNLNAYNNRRTSKNQGIYNPDHDNYQELSSIIKYTVLAVVLALIIVFWWILIPIAIIFAIYKITQ